MSDYRHDYAAFDELVLAAPFMVEAMVQVGEKIKDIAVATAPRDTGHYAGSFKVESGVRDEPTRRAYAKVINDAEYAIDLEYGTKDTPKFRTLGKAADAAAG